MIRAIRNRYFARSDGASFDQPSLERRARGLDREVDVLLVRLRHLGERLLGRRRDRVEPLVRLRLDELAADEEAVALLERDDVARLRRGRVVPLGERRNGRVLLLELAQASQSRVK